MRVNSVVAIGLVASACFGAAAQSRPVSAGELRSAAQQSSRDQARGPGVASAVAEGRPLYLRDGKLSVVTDEPKASRFQGQVKLRDRRYGGGRVFVYPYFTLGGFSAYTSDEAVALQRLARAVEAQTAAPAASSPPERKAPRVEAAPTPVVVPPQMPAKPRGGITMVVRGEDGALQRVRLTFDEQGQMTTTRVGRAPERGEEDSPDATPEQAPAGSASGGEAVEPDAAKTEDADG